MDNLRILFAPVSKTDPSKNAVKFVFDTPEDLAKAVPLIKAAMQAVDRERFCSNYKEPDPMTGVSNTTRLKKSELRREENAIKLTIDLEFSVITDLLEKLRGAKESEEEKLEDFKDLNVSSIKLYGAQKNYGTRVSMSEPIYRKLSFRKAILAGQDKDGSFVYVLARDGDLQYSRAKKWVPGWPESTPEAA